MALFPTLVGVLLVTIACGDSGDGSADPTPTSSLTGSPTAASSTATPSASSTPTESTGTSIALPDAGVSETGHRRLGTGTGEPTTARDPSFDPLEGTEGYHGRLGNSVYRIEMPDGWSGGGLLLWSHGFRGFGNEVSVSNPPGPLRSAIIDSGYAWAASSYDENGYTPGIGADATMALTRHFESQFGEASPVLIAGNSMGGNVVILALEHMRGEYDGGLSFCGAVGGEEQLDYLLSWGLLAEVFSGVYLPIGSSSARVLVALLQIGLTLGEPVALSPRGNHFKAAVRDLSGGSRPFFEEGFAKNFATNFGLLLSDPTRSTVAVAATTNVGFVYGAPTGAGMSADELNQAIRRIEPEVGTRDPLEHPDAIPTSGDLSAPLLSLHNTGDLFVPISLEVAYREKTMAVGTADLLVQRAIRNAGHCEFSQTEYARAWEDLRAWIEEGIRPMGEQLGDDLSDVGLAFTQPLRAGDPGGR